MRSNLFSQPFLNTSVLCIKEYLSSELHLLIQWWIFLSEIVLTWKRKTVTLFMFTAQFYYTFFRVYLNSQVKNHKSDISCTPPIISAFFKKSWRFLEKKSLQAHKNHVRWLRDLDFWESWSPNTTIRVRRLSRGPRIELLTNDKRSFFFFNEFLLLLLLLKVLLTFY